MPYITHREKQSMVVPRTPGELTYDLQQTIDNYCQHRLRCDGLQLRYEDISTVLGCLEGAKLDFIERIVKPYEARKLQENGDVWSGNTLKGFGIDVGN